MADVTMGHLFDKIYFSGDSTTHRGTRFERLVKRFLELDPTYAARFDRVVPWGEWEDRTGPDVGIDLVAFERDGGVCAVQCKFYDPQHQITKGDVDTFLSASGKFPFTSRLLVSTTDNWGGRTLKKRCAISRSQFPGLVWSSLKSP